MENVYWNEIWIDLRKNRIAIISIAFLVIIFVGCLSASFYIDYEKTSVIMDIANGNKLPNEENILGTDAFGRDIMSRLIWANVNTIKIATSSTLIAFIVGGMLGGIAGSCGGYIDKFIMKGMYILIIIPSLILIVNMILTQQMAVIPMALITLFIFMRSHRFVTTIWGIIFGIIFLVALGPSIDNIIISIAITLIYNVTKKVRDRVKDITETMKMHINYLDLIKNNDVRIISEYFINLALAIFAVMLLGFLGLGLQPPIPDLGGMLVNSLRSMNGLTSIINVIILVTLTANVGFSLKKSIINVNN